MPLNKETESIHQNSLLDVKCFFFSRELHFSNWKEKQKQNAKHRILNCFYKYWYNLGFEGEWLKLFDYEMIYSFLEHPLCLCVCVCVRVRECVCVRVNIYIYI